MKSAPLLTLLLLASCDSLTTDSVAIQAETANASLYSLEATSLDGQPVQLSDYEGKVSLVVNTASQCGFTSQYEGLVELQKKYAEQGFTILAFPSADFGGQEFDTAEEIQSFCSDRFAVNFPLFERSGVKEGEEQSPVYAFLGGSSGSLPGWNFGKYLVGRDGRVIEFYASPVKPTGDELQGAIEAALAAG